MADSKLLKDDSWGKFLPQQACIQLCETVSPDRLVCVFLHEVAHAGLDAMGYGDRLNMEAVAIFSGLFWPMFWRDNPDAFRWVMQQLGCSE